VTPKQSAGLSGLAAAGAAWLDERNCRIRDRQGRVEHERHLLPIK
jgi:hypothetical protein